MNTLSRQYYEEHAAAVKSWKSLLHSVTVKPAIQRNTRCIHERASRRFA